MAHTEAATVRKHVVVEAAIEHAFTVFTGRSGTRGPGFGSAGCRNGGHAGRRYVRARS